MVEYKKNFIRFMVDCGVLTFGEFTLKSGRKSPYFLNAGAYNTGFAINKLGEFYADCITEHSDEGKPGTPQKPLLLFGPAYKGIPLCVSAAAALNAKYGKDVSYCFDRKEAKDHGEGGVFVGKQPADNDRIIIVDDVVTSGKALGESLPKLRGAAKVDVTAMIITVNRMEKALNSELSAVQQIYKDYGIKVFSIVDIKDIIEAIESGIIEGKEYLPAIREYLDKYGSN
jgi:orotate phosphoribosyltransferase